jgi:tetratricopeptide (TPR) repeat protein
MKQLLSRSTSSIARWPVVVVAMLVMAPAFPTTEELLQQANTLASQGNLDQAELLYDQAEERANDPGLVAFNKGFVYSRRGDHRRAELYFRRALGDDAIPPPRQSKAFYNLGNALVQQAGASDLKRLQAAILCYEEALRITQDEGLKADATHNLEVAKLLWFQAQAKRPPEERERAWDDKQKLPDAPEEEPQDHGGKSPKDNQRLEHSPKQGPEIEKMQPVETKQAAPGQGNLPIIPDTDEVTSYAPEDARKVLIEAGNRLQKERQQHRSEARPGERPHANDW